MNSPDPTNEPQQRKGFAEGLKDYGPFLTSGMQLALGVVVFFFIGVWLDGKLESSPWFTIIGAFIGATGGLIKFIREAMEFGRASDERKSPKKQQ